MSQPNTTRIPCKNPSSPALQAYKVYYLSQRKLDVECRRQTPDLHRLVAHATIVDNVRRWSRDIAEPTETVLIESDSDADSDPFEDSASDDEYEDAVVINDVSIFDYEVDNDEKAAEAETHGKVYEIQTGVMQHVEDASKPPVPKPKRRPPPPPPATSRYEFKDQNWRQNRPVVIRETAVEVDADD